MSGSQPPKKPGHDLNSPKTTERFFLRCRFRAEVSFVSMYSNSCRSLCSFTGLTVEHLPEQHCMRPGFDLTVASRQGLSFAGLTVEHLPEQHCMRSGFDLPVASRQVRSFLRGHLCDRTNALASRSVSKQGSRFCPMTLHSLSPSPTSTFPRMSKKTCV